MAEELERKYLDAAADEVRPRLIALGASPLHGPHFESNVLYDRPDLSLRGRREILRLRTREWPDHVDARLTFKAPLPDALIDGRPAKRREELETGVGDPACMHAVLLKLGYVEVARYEKVRESWTLDGAHVDMDQLPFMRCVEIEASAALLARMEHVLGLDLHVTSANSYHVLYLDWLARHQLPRQDSFVFERETRRRLRRSLSLAE